MLPVIPDVIKQIPNTQMAESAFSQLVNAVKEYKTIKETEITKREYIRAKRDIAISKINAQKDILKIYFEYTFKERKAVFEGFFNALDKGMETNNDKVITYAMQGIISTMQNSPLQGVNDFMRQLENPDVQELEI